MEIHLAYFSEVFKIMIKQVEAATALFPSFVMCTMAYLKGMWILIWFWNMGITFNNSGSSECQFAVTFWLMSLEDKMYVYFPEENEMHGEYWCSDPSIKVAWICLQMSTYSNMGGIYSRVWQECYRHVQIFSRVQSIDKRGSHPCPVLLMEQTGITGKIPVEINVEDHRFLFSCPLFYMSSVYKFCLYIVQVLVNILASMVPSDMISSSLN